MSSIRSYDEDKQCNFDVFITPQSGYEDDMRMRSETPIECTYLRAQAPSIFFPFFYRDSTNVDDLSSLTTWYRNLANFCRTTSGNNPSFCSSNQLCIAFQMS